MALKFVHASKDEIPAEHVALYVEKDGKWILDVDGAVPVARLDEFRDTNRGLMKERDELKKRFEGIDPDEAKRLMTIKDDLEKGRNKDGKTVEQLVDERTAKMKTDLEKRATEAEAALAIREADLAKLKINDAVLAAAVKKGLKPTAADDVAMRAQQTFKLKDGRPVAFEGDKEAYGKTGDPLTIDEYVDGLITKAPHLFEASSGGGAGGSGNGNPPTGQGVNYWKKEHWNMSKQGELVKKDPKQAAALARAAGKPVTWAVP